MLSKITILITDITKSAGTERVVVNLSNSFVELGYDVEIVSFNSKTGSPYYTLNENVNVVHWRLKQYENQLYIKKIFYFLVNLFFVYKKIRKINNSIIIGTSRNVNIYSLLFLKNHNRFIACEHFSCKSQMSRLMRLIRDCFYLKLKYLVVLTEFDKQYYRKRRINAITIPNFVDIQFNGAFHEKQNIILAVGRHSIEKNFEGLVKIWASIYNKFPNWKLQIVGDGFLFNQNKRLAEELDVKNIEFLPFTKDIFSFYEKASIYTMTSLNEAFPMVLLEAMSHKVVCVSFDCDSGPREIINNTNGFLVPIGDNSRFIASLKLLIENEDIRYKMSNNAFDSIKRFSKDSILKKWSSLFELVK